MCVYLLFFVEFLFCLRLSFSFFFCLFVLFSYVVLFEFPPISSFLGFPLSAFSYQVDVFQLFFSFFLLFNSVLYQSLNMYRFNSQIGLWAVAKGPLFVCLQQLIVEVQRTMRICLFLTVFLFFVLYGVCFVSLFVCLSVYL